MTTDAPFPGLDDIWTEPDPSPDTLAHLGPLAALAGTWEGVHGTDVHPVREGAETDAYLERLVLEPIDAQTNGPQLFYGLRYHQHIVRPGETATFHDQVGYLLWEPATGAVHFTLAIPRAQVAMASGTAAADAREFTLRAAAGDPHAGIISNPWLDAAYRTTAWEITFRTGDDGALHYDQTTTLEIHGRPEPFAHTDSAHLHRVAPPAPNPLAAP